MTEVAAQVPTSKLYNKRKCNSNRENEREDIPKGENSNSKSSSTELALRDFIKLWAFEEKKNRREEEEDEDLRYSNGKTITRDVVRVFEESNETECRNYLKKYFPDMDFFAVEFIIDTPNCKITDPSLVVLRKVLQPSSLIFQCSKVIERQPIKELDLCRDSTLLAYEGLPLELVERVSSDDFKSTMEMRNQTRFYFSRYDSRKVFRLLLDSLRPLKGKNEMKEVSKLLQRLHELPLLLCAFFRPIPVEWKPKILKEEETENPPIFKYSWEMGSQWKFEFFIEFEFEPIEDGLHQLKVIRGSDPNFSFVLYKKMESIQLEEKYVGRRQ